MGNPIRMFALAVALLVAVAAAVFAADEAELIAILKSDAPQKEKADACRALARVGTKNAVPVLATLLGDERLSHMARYALEPIPDPSVDVALRDALSNVKGRPLIGVIGSLGVRRDAKAVEALGKLLADPDAEVAQSAARALGKIGTPEAARALETALAAAPPANQVDFCEGLFRCAETMAAEGHASLALAIYDRLRQLASAPQQVRCGALRGAVLARGKEGIPLLLEALRGADYVLTAAAARVAIEMPGPDVTAALADGLPKLPADKQILVINTLGYRGDASAGPALLALASQGPAPVRLAAILNLTHLGCTSVLPLLGELALGGEGDLAAAARECLANFPGENADATIAAMLAHQDPKVRALAVEMIGQRSAPAAAAALVKAVDDADETVRLAALRGLRDRAGMAELHALLRVLLKARSPAESEAAEAALGAMCARLSEPAGGSVVIVKAEYGNLPDGPAADVTDKVAVLVKQGALAVEASNGNFGDPAHGVVKKLRVDYTVNGVAASKTVGEGETLTFTALWTPPAIVDAICQAMDQAQREAKPALVRLLRAAGGPKALQTVLAAAADSDPAIKEAAWRALCDWPTPDALPAVADLLRTSPNKTIKVLALRGFVRLVPQQDIPDAKKVDALKEAMQAADRSEEKRLVLSALGNVATVDALAMAVSHLEDAELKEEACLAAVTIAEKLGPSHRDEVVAAMQQVAKRTGNKKLATRANALARQAKP